jgi:hypothetical protein
MGEVISSKLKNGEGKNSARSLEWSNVCKGKAAKCLIQSEGHTL